MVLSITLSINCSRHVLTQGAAARLEPLKTKGAASGDAVRLTPSGSYKAEVGGSRPSTPTGRCQKHNVCAGHDLFRVSDRSNSSLLSNPDANRTRCDLALGRAATRFDFRFCSVIGTLRSTTQPRTDRRLISTASRAASGAALGRRARPRSGNGVAHCSPLLAGYG
jgi:hypothetical protein